MATEDAPRFSSIGKEDVGWIASIAVELRRLKLSQDDAASAIENIIVGKNDFPEEVSDRVMAFNKDTAVIVSFLVQECYRAIDSIEGIE